MHEITLSQRALEIIEQQAQQAGARRVTCLLYTSPSPRDA